MKRSRLRELEPEVVGAEAELMLGAQLEWAAARLGRSLGAAPQPGATPLAQAVASVVRYAQRGEGQPELVARQVGDLMWAMGFSPDGEGELERVQGGREPLSPAGVVLAAALARLELASGQSPTQAGLAALAGASLGEVRGLVLEGRLAPAGEKVRHHDAAAWLAGRGVAGI